MHIIAKPQPAAKPAEFFCLWGQAPKLSAGARPRYQTNEIVKTYAKNYIGDKKGLIAGMWSALLR